MFLSYLVEDLKAVFDRIRFQLFFAVQNAQTKHKLFEV
jgi:hypothetical protein